MAIEIKDNFNSLNYFPNEYIKLIRKDKKFVSNRLDINLKDYQDEKNPDNIFFSFFRDQDKINSKNEDDLIISIKKDIEGNYLAQTGNYVGKFKWQGLDIDIKSRFSNSFLERMLNFANDIFLDDVSITGNSVDKDFDISKYIIYYMFVQNLEKAFLLGLPKSYTTVKHHEMKVKGKIDINNFIKKDVPFQGKVSSVSRDQKEIQEIVDVLYKAIKIIDDNNKVFTKNITHIKNHLKLNRSKCYISNETINKALKSKALQNPIFYSYKKVLEYAKFIIKGNNIEEKKNGEKETYGFIINVAELFEIYVTKLLQNEFPTWNVSSPKIELYDNPSMFYRRKIIPDIVIVKEKDVIVFDTKYKKMLFRTRDNFSSGDVDRNDFFQINTYMSYYQNNGFNVKKGGLIYPIEKSFKDNKNVCHSDTWFGNKDTKFIVDGIDLSGDLDSYNSIIKREEKFIEGIKKRVS